VKDLDIIPELNPCTLQIIGPVELTCISQKFKRYYSEEKMLSMLSKGWKCIGLKYKNEIISLRWYNFQECDNKLLPFPLQDNEVYISGALTFNKYRRKRVASYLSLKMYECLSRLDRTIFYSIVAFSNISAIRFQKKLNGFPYRLYFFIELFKKYRWRILLKKYKN